MKLAAQCRVSTDEQKEGQTIDAQISSIKNLVGLHSHEIVEWYIEDGVSGATLNRETFDKLREDAKTGKFEAIASVRPDRFSRDQADQLLVLKEFDTLGIKCIFTSLPGSENLTGVAKIINRGTNAMFSEYERQVIIERTTNGRLSRVKSGNICTSRPPYGLSYVRRNIETKELGHFKHNPQEIDYLKLILGWAKQGWSQRKIIRELFNRKIPTRNGKLKWQKSTIGKILGVNLDVYAGTWHYLKYQHTEPKFRIKNIKYPKTRKSSRALRDKEDWLSVKLPSELVILTLQDVELIKSRQKQNRTFSAGNTKYNYLLQRMLSCNKCQGQNGCDNFHGTAYYRCLDRKRRFPDPAQCTGGSIKSQTLDDAVWNDIKRLILQPDLIKQEATKYIETKKDDGVIRSTVFEEIASKRNGLEKQKERIDDGFREGLYSLEEAKAQKAKVNDLLIKLDQAEVEELENIKKLGQIDYSALTKDIDSLCQDLNTVLGKLEFEERRQILQWLSLKVMVGDYRYSIEGSLPIYSANSRPQRFTERSARSR